MFRSSTEFEIFCNMSVLHMIFSNWFLNLYARSVSSISIYTKWAWIVYVTLFLNLFHEWIFCDLVCNHVIPPHISGHCPVYNFIPFLFNRGRKNLYTYELFKCLTMCEIYKISRNILCAVLFDWNFCAKQSRIFCTNRIKFALLRRCILIILKDKNIVFEI